VCRGHHTWRETAYKILRAGYYWPKLFPDVNAKVRACNPCQLFAGKHKLPALPLVPVKMKAPFQQWGLDFIDEINPHSSAQHKWILTTTDYFTKWVEAIPTRKATNSVVMDFLEENSLSRFGCPRKIVTDNVQAFKSMAMVSFFQKYNIVLGHSMTYYPQGNGLVKSSNKSLISIIKKVLSKKKKILSCAFEIRFVGESDRYKKIYYHFSFPNGIWDQRIVTYKSSTSRNETLAR
jgi:hypothetical protein